MKAALFALTIFGLQSALAMLLPSGFAVPDVVLLAALAVAARLEPVVGLLVGFALGLLQDVFGAGVLGFHAAGLAAGVYASFFVRRYLSAETSLNHASAVMAAQLAKWLVFLALGLWAGIRLVQTETVWVLAAETLGTLLLGPFVFWLATWAFGPVPQSDERLL